MRIKVQWQDILRGSRRAAKDCAVARAIRRQVPEVTHVLVGRRWLDYGTPNLILRQTVEGLLRDKIRAFDRHRVIWPFAFELRTDGFQSLRASPLGVRDPELESVGV